MITTFKMKKVSIFFSVFYIFIQIISGANFGFIKWKSSRIKYLAYSISFVQAVCFSVACLIQTYKDHSFYMFLRHFMYVIEYIGYLFAFMLLEKEVTLAECRSIFKQVDL